MSDSSNPFIIPVGEKRSSVDFIRKGILSAHQLKLLPLVGDIDFMTLLIPGQINVVQGITLSFLGSDYDSTLDEDLWKGLFSCYSRYCEQLNRPFQLADRKKDVAQFLQVNSRFVTPAHKALQGGLDAIEGRYDDSFFSSMYFRKFNLSSGEGLAFKCLLMVFSACFPSLESVLMAFSSSAVTVQELMFRCYCHAKEGKGLIDSSQTQKFSGVVSVSGKEKEISLVTISDDMLERLKRAHESASSTKMEMLSNDEACQQVSIYCRRMGVMPGYEYSMSENSRAHAPNHICRLVIYGMNFPWTPPYRSQKDARRCAAAHVAPFLLHALENSVRTEINYSGMLQEWTSRRHLLSPSYSYEQRGTSFRCTVKVGEQEFVGSFAFSQTKARHSACQIALDELGGPAMRNVKGEFMEISRRLFGCVVFPVLLDGTGPPHRTLHRFVLTLWDQRFVSSYRLTKKDAELDCISQFVQFFRDRDPALRQLAQYCDLMGFSEPEEYVDPSQPLKKFSFDQCVISEDKGEWHRLVKGTKVSIPSLSPIGISASVFEILKDPLFKKDSMEFEVKEFFGDSLLYFIVSKECCDAGLDDGPYELTRRRSSAVCNSNLARLYDILGFNEKVSPLYTLKRKADCIECLIGELFDPDDVNSERSVLLLSICRLALYHGERVLVE